MIFVQQFIIFSFFKDFKIHQDEESHADPHKMPWIRNIDTISSPLLAVVSIAVPSATLATTATTFHVARSLLPARAVLPGTAAAARQTAQLAASGKDPRATAARSM